jgi:hypothetical protein
MTMTLNQKFRRLRELNTPGADGWHISSYSADLSHEATELGRLFHDLHERGLWTSQMAQEAIREGGRAYVAPAPNQDQRKEVKI